MRLAELVNPRYAPMLYKALGAVALAAVGMLVPFDVIRIPAFVVLLGAAYGIINDMFACRDCIEYFTVGHIFDAQELRQRLLTTLNPNLNALAWGIVATWRYCFATGLILMLFAQMPLPDIGNLPPVRISLQQLVPWLVYMALITLVLAHIICKSVYQYAKNTERFVVTYSVPSSYQLGWLQCDVRNSVGYAFLFIGGLGFAIVTMFARYDFVSL